jgi:hypothetical protein
MWLFCCERSPDTRQPAGYRAEIDEPAALRAWRSAHQHPKHERVLLVVEMRAARGSASLRGSPVRIHCYGSRRLGRAARHGSSRLRRGVLNRAAEGSRPVGKRFSLASLRRGEVPHQLSEGLRGPGGAQTREGATSTTDRRGRDAVFLSVNPPLSRQDT